MSVRSSLSLASDVNVVGVLSKKGCWNMQDLLQEGYLLIEYVLGVLIALLSTTICSIVVYINVTR